MYRCAHSYIGEGRERQTLIRIALIALVALSLGGCGRLGLGGRDAGPLAYTGSIKPAEVKNTSYPADPDDWSAISHAIEKASKRAERFDWANPNTGSVGTVAIAEARLGSCRPFATVINDVHGIRRYRGNACLVFDGRAQLRDIVADDATLS
jgi:hypothetical protein